MLPDFLLAALQRRIHVCFHAHGFEGFSSAQRFCSGS
jgi:hypothetical protein